MFKQLFQAEAIDVCQLDACRVGGVNEAISILLLAAKFGVPVCPHAGGVGLCEYVQHLAFFDYIAVSGSLENRVVEWVDHLHEHFRDPAIVRDGRYVAPDRAGLQHRDAAGVARRVRVPRRAGVGRRRVSRWERDDGAVTEPKQMQAPRPARASTATGCCRSGLWSLRAGPALILLLLIVIVGADDARLPDEPEHRQRLLADLGDRRRSRSGSSS